MAKNRKASTTRPKRRKDLCGDPSGNDNDNVSSMTSQAIST